MNKAKEYLTEDNKLVLCSGNVIYTSKKHGVSGLLEIIEKETDVRGYDCADKVVGKGASFLYVLLGVRQVHSCVISRCALDVLIRYGIDVTYDTLVDRIENRTKTGYCPIEEAVISIDDPVCALQAIKNTLKEIEN